MRIGIPTEIKNNENRVAITPAGVKELASAGHQVFVQQGAGLGSMIDDAEFEEAGAEILADAAEVWTRSEMILKVKEPMPAEYGFFRPGLVLFTYLHLAPELELTKKLIESGVVAIAYETVQTENGALPLLAPMSEVAGRMSVQIGAEALTKPAGGRGLLLGGTTGVAAGHVVIIGAGTVGVNAAKLAVGMGARVTILDSNLNRLRAVDDIFGSRLQTLASNHYNVAESVREADLVIGSVLIPGAMTPKLVTEDMVRSMRPGSVIVDVAIDQGGCIATTARHGATTHDHPTFVEYGVVHYSVANMPGAVPRTSTYALTNATIFYAAKLAATGWKEACRSDVALASGINICEGHCCFKGVAEALNLPYTPVQDVLA